MDSQSEESSCKFSSENWKILKEFKEVKHKHDLFAASIMTSQESLFKNLENPKKSESYHRSESPTFEIRLQEIIDHTSQESDKDLESVKLFSPSQYIKKDSDELESFSDEKERSLLKVEKYCRELLCLPKTEDCKSGTSQIMEKDEKVIKDCIRDAPDGVETLTEDEIDARKRQHKYISPSMSLMASVLLRIPKLRSFVKDCLAGVSTVIKQQQKYPTLNFFVDVNENMEKFSSNQSDSDEAFKEPMSLLVLSTLEIFHEELTQAKSESVLKRSCYMECRYTKKKNHSIVSHLFRGYFTKKLACECGYTRNMQQAFTDVPVLMQDFQRRTIIVDYLGSDKMNELKAAKILLSITNWTKISDMKDILQTALKRAMKDLDVELNMAFFTFVDGQNAKILNENLKICQLISEDFTLFVSDINLGTHPSLNTTTNGRNSNAKKIISSSTPVFSECASSFGRLSSEMSSMKIPEIESNSKISALIAVKLIWLDAAFELNMVLEFPKICNGLYVFERINRMVGLTLKDFSSINVKIFSKVGLCIFCLSKFCNGCPMQLNDRVLLSQHYVIATRFFHLDVPNNLKEPKEDKSIIENSPITILTLNECLTYYAERDNSHCPTCFEKCDWKPSETYVKKFPDVLIVHFENKFIDSEWLHFPRQNFKPVIGKRKSKFDYNVVCLTTADDDTCIYLYDNNEWIMKCGDVMQVIEDVPTVGIEMLVYLKDTENFPCIRSQCKINERVRRKKRMGNTTTYSTRSARLRKPYDVIGKGFVSETSSYMTDGTYTTLQSDQDSACNCMKCHTLGKVHSQILQARSCESNKKLQERKNGANYKQQSVSQHSVAQTDNLSRGGYRGSRATLITSSVSSAYEEGGSALEKILHKSIRNQNLKDVVKCLKDGADVNHVLNGVGALHLVSAMPAPFGAMFTKLFLEHGADPNLHASDGFTPVHVATMWGREETLALLLQRGGLPEIKDSEGKSAFQFLLKNGSNSEKLLRILRAEEKNLNVSAEEKKYLKQRKSARNSPGDETRMANVSGDSGDSASQKETSGEMFVGDVFRQNEHVEVPTLNESIVSHHMSDLDNSDISYDGSVKYSLWSLLLCSGKFSKIRRRQGEERWVTRVVRQRISRWIQSIFNRD